MKRFFVYFILDNDEKYVDSFENLNEANLFANNYIDERKLGMVQVRDESGKILYKMAYDK